MQCIHTADWPARFRSGISFEWPLDSDLPSAYVTDRCGFGGEALMQETSKRVKEIKAAEEISEEGDCHF